MIPSTIDLALRTLEAAGKTLLDLGYTYHGGERWKPPVRQAESNNNACRYQWLRARPVTIRWPDFLRGAQLDEAIDKEIGMAAQHLNLKD